MIGYLRGDILEHSDGKVLVGMGGGTGQGMIGYVVSVPQRGVYLGWLPGQVVELFIHTNVREDAFDLFGFQTRSEKELFLTLLSVNGIGPKSALGILSSVESTQLVEAIVDEDKTYLTKIPGIGKKTAERVVMELKDVVRKKVEAGVFSLRSSQLGTDRSQGSASVSKTAGFHQSLESTVLRDAKGALLGLGYREQDVQTVLKQAWESQSSPPERAEELIRTALRFLV